MKGLAGIVAVLGVLAAVLAATSESAPRTSGHVNGRIVFNDQRGRLVLVNPDGSGLVQLVRTNAPDWIVGTSFSPDGTRVAYSAITGSDPDVYVIRLDGSGQRQITFSRGTDVDPSWSREGTRLAFESNRNGNVDIYSVQADGTDSTRLTAGPENELDPAWSPTADRIAYTVESTDGGSRQIWVMNGDGSGKRQLTAAANFSENPHWSPDGRWLAFDSDRAEKGDLEIYKMRADGTSVQRLTNSPALDALPVFSPDGQLILFVSDRAAKDSRKLYVMGANGGVPRRLLHASGWTYQMVPDWQPLHAKDPCTIRGTIHVDRIAGTRKGETICGLGGDDLIEGLGGNDRLLGGAGNDRLTGGAGADLLSGEAGDDWLIAKDGRADTVSGGPGRDRGARRSEARPGHERGEGQPLGRLRDRGAHLAARPDHDPRPRRRAKPAEHTDEVGARQAHAAVRRPAGGHVQEDPRPSSRYDRPHVELDDGDMGVGVRLLPHPLAPVPEGGPPSTGDVLERVVGR